MAFNLVELAASSDGVEDCSFDQPCKFGHRVEGHAVYCHNDEWADSPRKCRRSWYTGGEIKDEDCPGFQPNPNFTACLNPTAIAGGRCSQCAGMRIIKADRGTLETCRRCMGDGSEPHAVRMSQFEQDALEMGLRHTGRNPATYYPHVLIARSAEERRGVDRLIDMDLLELRSMQSCNGALVLLVELTPKGDAIMRANWATRKAISES